MQLVEIKDLTLQFSEKQIPVFKNFSLSIKRGDIVALVGPSGAGKSLLAKTLIGIQPANCKILQGSIKFFEHSKNSELLDFTEKEWQEFRKNHVSMIFQNPGASLNPSLKIRKQFDTIYQLVNPKSNAAKQEEVYLEILRDFDFSDANRILNAFPHQLSGGQLQRIIIAMTVIKKPSLWIADEPTTALDYALRKNILEYILKAQEQINAALLFISHDLESVDNLADRTIVIGENHKISSSSPKIKSAISNVPILNFKNVTKTFQQNSFLGFGKKYQIDVLNKVDFKINRGEVLGLSGASGSGKSTIGNLILNLIEKDSGEILFENKSLENTQNEVKDRVKIQGIFQNPLQSLTPNRTVKQHLVEAFQLHESTSGEKFDTVHLLDILTKTGLDESFLRKFPHELSGGECQRICIARAFIMKPILLVCDEITSSLDRYNEEKILMLIESFVAENQTAVLFISHNLELIDRFCDRTLKMEDLNS